MSLANLPEAIQVFDQVLLYDSSAFDQRPRLVARLVGGKLISRSAALPRWCTSGAVGSFFEE
jgi:hypothetical protein